MYIGNIMKVKRHTIKIFVYKFMYTEKLKYKDSYSDNNNCNACKKSESKI